jgi:probable F420-dependent oxidoreductase
MSDLQIDVKVDGLPCDVESHARTAEELGVDCIWSHETAHDAFLPHSTAAAHTEEAMLGTRIATSFTRSPMVLAQMSWDLQAYSDGRFILGLGPQVKAHNERRFSVDFEWESPGPRLRGVIESVQHIWDVFQGRADDLDYDGEFYQFSLITDNFNPGPIDDPDIPIYIAGVNEYNIRLAGELCDGLCMHGFNTPSYTREVIEPVVMEGVERAGRSRADVSISASPFVITGRTEEERQQRRQEIRERVAFYASTPTYKSVMEHHGWVETGRELHELTRENRWDEMPDLVTDEMLETFAIDAPLEEVPDAIREEYGDVADRVVLPFEADEGSHWNELVAQF